MLMKQNAFYCVYRITADLMALKGVIAIERDIALKGVIAEM